MPKAQSLINVTFSTGEVYKRGKIYDVPAETLKKYPADFKKMTTKPENKSMKTEENK